MGDEKPGSPAQGDGVEIVMQKYTYPGQWFDDMGAMVATVGPGLTWDLGTSGKSREELNDLIAVYQDMAGISNYPGE